MEECSVLKQEAKFLEVIQRDGVASLATCGPDGVHLVATWNRFLMVQDEMLLIPAGGYRKTQSNAEKGSLVQLLVGSPEVEGKNGKPGCGYRLTGQAEFHETGVYFQAIKEQFPWARAALVLRVEKIEQLM